jgi:hypothetical protein
MLVRSFVMDGPLAQPMVSQDPLRQDVLLDLVGTAPDPHARGTQSELAGQGSHILAREPTDFEFGDDRVVADRQQA